MFLCVLIFTIKAQTTQAKTYTKVDLMKLYAQEWGFLTYYTSAASENERLWFDFFSQSLKELDVTDNPKKYKELSDKLLSMVKFPDNKFNPDWQVAKTDTLLNPNLYSWMNDSLFDDVVKLKFSIVKQNPVITPSRFRPYRFVGIDFSDTAVFNSKIRKTFKVENEYEALAAFVIYWNAANYYGAYPIGRKYQWSNVLDEFIPQFLALKKYRGYDLFVNYRNLMQRVVARSEDAHSLVFVRIEGVQNYIQVEYIDSVCYVIKIHPKLSELYHIQQGDIIIEKDGVPMTAIYEELKKYFRVSDPLYTDYKVLQYLLTFSHPNTHLKIQKPDKKIYETDIRSADIQSLKEKDTLMEYKSWQPPKGTYSNHADTVFNDSIGYINVGMKNDRSLIKKLKEFSATKCLILDFREYPSNTNFAFTTSEKNCFYSYNSSIPDKSTKSFIDKTPGHFQKETKFVPRPFDRPGLIKWEHYGRNKKVYLLCNEFTKSKAEWLLMFYYAVTKGTVVGRNTAGVPSSVGLIYLPGMFCTLITIGEGHDYKKRLISGRGFEPDVYVKKDINSIIAGEDYILNKTLELIYKK